MTQSVSSCQIRLGGVNWNILSKRGWTPKVRNVATSTYHITALTSLDSGKNARTSLIVVEGLPPWGSSLRAATRDWREVVSELFLGCVLMEFLNPLFQSWSKSFNTFRILLSFLVFPASKALRFLLLSFDLDNHGGRNSFVAYAFQNESYDIFYEA